MTKELFVFNLPISSALIRTYSDPCAVVVECSSSKLNVASESFFCELRESQQTKVAATHSLNGIPNRPCVWIKRPLYRAKELGANKTAPQVEGRGFDRWTGNPSEDNQSSLETRGEQTSFCAVEKD